MNTTQQEKCASGKNEDEKRVRSFPSLAHSFFNVVYEFNETKEKIGRQKISKKM